MELVIENPEGIDYDDFAVWLCMYLGENALEVVPRTPQLEEVWNNYFKEVDLGWSRDDRGNVSPPTVNYILNSYFDNLEVKKRGSDYIITCRDEVRLRGTRLTIDNLATTINEGNLSVPRYPYIDDIFDAVADGIDEFYDIYEDTTGGTVQ